MSTAAVIHSPKFKNYFSKQKLALKVFCISISENESVVYRIYSCIVIFFFYFLYVFLSLRELFKNDMSVIGDTIAYQVAIVLALSKATLTLRNRSKFRQILDKLERDPFRPNIERGGNVEEELIGECLWITNWQTLVYVFLCTFSVFASVIYALIRRAKDSTFKDLAYGPITVLNITNSPNFELTCVYQGISIYHLAMAFCTVDLFLAGVLSHISYQFKIVQNNYKQLVTIGYNKMLKDTNNISNSALVVDLNGYEEIDGSLIPWKYLKEALIEVVQYHLAIIDLAREIEDMFSSLLLFLFLGTLLMVGMLVLRASQMPLSDARAFSTLAEAVCGCTQVLIVCFWGEEMVFQSQQVGLAVYGANFVGTDVRFQKFLTLIMRRSLNPTIITAGKFTPIRLTTFIWVMRSAYTAFMVLRSREL